MSLVVYHEFWLSIMSLLFIYLIFSLTSQSWVDCSSSNDHSTHYLAVTSYFNIMSLRHYSFYCISSISYSYSIVVFLTSASWPNWSPQSWMYWWGSRSCCWSWRRWRCCCRCCCCCCLTGWYLPQYSPLCWSSGSYCYLRHLV